ncbi:MAG: serine protease [Caulobacterales bacterium]
MHFPRLPDWLIYLAVVVALIFAALGRQERADAPPPPPPLPAGEGAVLGAASPFDPAIVVKLPKTPQGNAGTAFSVGDGGVWLTARHVVDGCAKAAILVSEGQGVEAKVRIDPMSESAILTTDGGAPALPMRPDQPLRRGARAFLPGFPQDHPGEIAVRLLGRERLFLRGRTTRSESVLVWAEVGRTEGLKGPLGGISGAPAVDAAGRVIGVTIAQAPRRGRIYTTTPAALRAALAAVHAHPSTPPEGQEVTTENYGRMADELRRDLRVAAVVCVAR